MTVIRDSIAVLQGVTGLAGLVFMLLMVFFTGGHRSFFSRSLLLLETGIFVVMVYALEHFVVGPPYPFVDHQWIGAISAWGVLAILQIMVTAGLWMILISRRGGLRKALTFRRLRRSAQSQPEDPVMTIAAGLNMLSDVEYDMVMATARRNR